MTDILEQILADKYRHVSERKESVCLKEMHDRALQGPAVRSFTSALKSKVMAGDIGLIAEIKKGSPSAGIIRQEFSPSDIARAYESGGAACLSILTDAPYFHGKNEDLIEARSACGLPVLRKDFMVDTWQIAEARAIGADCILIIMAALKDAKALELYHAATGYGMDVLVEVHDRIELERALSLPGGMIGINNRNLKTLSIDLNTTEELAQMIPPDRLVVSESGLKTAQDLARIQKIGVHCFLIGESLLKNQDVASATLALRVG